jgi:hypothetical protein
MGAGLGECEVLLHALSRRTASIGAVMTVQLSFDLTALADLNPGPDIVLMMEVEEESTHVRHRRSPPRESAAIG